LNRNGPSAALLANGRLHLQHGPIDLIIEAWGERAEVAAAYRQASARFADILEVLVQELAQLRTPLGEAYPLLRGPVARRMLAACWPYRAIYITPMAAVAGSVADEILQAMLEGRSLERAYVNNGGDIALHLAQGTALTLGVVNNVDNPAIDATVTLSPSMPVRGLATSGWRGRSQSLGIADAVTVFAADAAAADAAAVDAAADNKNPYIYMSKETMGEASLKLGLGSFGLKVVYRLRWRYSFRWRIVRRVTFAGFFKRTKMPVDLSAINKYEDLLFSSGFTQFCKGAVFISDRPSEVHLNENKRLHNLNGPAAKWRDGSAIFKANGISIPNYIALTSKDSFTKKMILNEKNADYRRLIIQKIGIEKTIELLGAEVISEETFSVGGKYQLLSIDYDNSGNRRPYLRMENPSLGLTHIEGVSNECKTVRDALAYRNGMVSYYEPVKLT